MFVDRGTCKQPFVGSRRHNGVYLVYMWQPSTGRHAYYSLDRDLILG
jgi:hypothetical protein